MKTQFKKILSIVLVAVMCLSMFPMAVFADDAVMPTCPDPNCHVNTYVTATGLSKDEADCFNAAGDWYVCSNAEAHETKTPLEFIKAYEGSVSHHSVPENITHVEAKEPTCAEPGNYEYWECSKCGEYYKDKALTKNNTFKDGAEVIPVKAYDVRDSHTYNGFDWVDGILPVCGVNGGTKVFKCTLCDYFYTEEVPATEHVWKYQSHVDVADCLTDTVVTEKCVNCPATREVTGYGWNHSYVKTDAVSKTCTTAGNEAYWTCEHCGRFFMEIAADEFGTDDFMFYDESDATIYVEMVEEGAWIVPASHSSSFTVTPGKQPTCTEGGWKTYVTCGECGKYFYSSAATDAEIEYENAYATEIAKDAWLLTALGHDVVLVEAKAPSCTAAGNTAYYDCTACDLYFVDAKEGDVAYDVAKVLLNDVEIAVVEVAKDSWLTDMGATGHTLVHHAAVAECGKVATIEYWACTVCGYNYGANDVNATEALESVLASVEVPNPDGTNSTIVVNPGDELYDKVGGEQHVWEYTGVKAPTCFLWGWTTWTCAHCDKYTGAANAYSVDLAPTAHANMTVGMIIPEKAPTCVADGMGAYAQCPDCKYYFAVDADGNILNAEGDKYYDNTDAFILSSRNTYHNDGVRILGTEVSCLIEGKTDSYVCTLCWEYYYYVDGKVVNLGKNIDPSKLEGYEAKHSVDNGKIVFVPAVGATCATAGSVAHFYCADCDKYYKADANDEIVNAYNNDGDWIGYEELATIVATRDHDYGALIIATFNCGKDGYAAHYVCQYDDCGLIFDVDKNETTMDALSTKATGAHFAEDWAYWTVITPITPCENKSEHGLAGVKMCTECGYQTAIDQHTYTAIEYNGEGLREPTCTVEGIYKLACERCGYYQKTADGKADQTYTAPVVPHTDMGNPDHVLFKDSDCFNAGNIEYWQCLACKGKFTTANLAPDSLIGENHSEGIKTEVIAPEHEGLIDFVFAAEDKVCGVVYPAQKYCSDCEYYSLKGDFSDKQTTPFTSTDVTLHTGALTSNGDFKAPTCLVAGHKETFTCQGECGKTFIKNADDTYTEATEENVVIAIVAHNGTLVAYKAPTCTDAGNEAYFTVCTVADGCGKIYGATADGKVDTTIVYDATKTYVIDALGHEVGTSTPAVDSVCIDLWTVTDGNIAYYTCAVCEKNFAAGDLGAEAVELTAETIKAPKHVPFDNFVAAMAPTCTEEGYESYICDCGYVYYMFIAPVRINNVDKNETKIEPTCSETGLEVYYYCANCQMMYKDAEHKELFSDKTFATAGEAKAAATIAATNKHVNIVDGVKTEIVPGCSGNAFDPETGDVIYTVDRTCDECGEDFTKDHKPIDVSVSANCTNIASTYKACKVCHEINEATRNSWGYTDPTKHGELVEIINEEVKCNDTARAYEQCQLCKQQVGDSYAKSHNYQEDTSRRVEPTCGATGTAYHVCEYCGDEKIETLGDGADHDNDATDESRWVLNTAKYDAPNYTVDDAQVQTCTKCGKNPIYRAMPDVKFDLSMDSGVVAGAELVNSGKLAVTIKYSAFQKKANAFILTFDYSDNLIFSGAEFSTVAKAFGENSATADGSTVTLFTMRLVASNFKLDGENEVYVVLYFDIADDANGEDVWVSDLTVDQILTVDGADVDTTIGKADDSKAVAKLGNVNGDANDEIDLKDAQALMLLANDLSADYNARADFDKDGDVDPADFIAIRKYLAGAYTYDQLINPSAR